MIELGMSSVTCQDLSRSQRQRHDPREKTCKGKNKIHGSAIQSQDPLNILKHMTLITYDEKRLEVPKDD